MSDLSIRTALDKEFRPTRGDFLQTILIELSPGTGRASIGNAAGRTLPLNLGILLDNSGSMDGPKLENAKRACQLILERLKPEDRATVCVFSSGSRAIVPSTPFVEGARERAVRAVADLRVEGATELLTGLNTVFSEVAPHR
ncbi:VWA domain-containing protein, partial [bacterium]